MHCWFLLENLFIRCPTFSPSVTSSAQAWGGGTFDQYHIPLFLLAREEVILYSQWKEFITAFL